MCGRGPVCGRCDADTVHAWIATPGYFISLGSGIVILRFRVESVFLFVVEVIMVLWALAVTVDYLCKFDYRFFLVVFFILVTYVCLYVCSYVALNLDKNCYKLLLMTDRYEF